MAEQQRALERESGVFVEVLEREAERNIDRIHVGSTVQVELERNASVLVEGLQYKTDVGVHAIQDVGQRSISSMTTTASLLVEGLQYETDVGVHAIHAVGQGSKSSMTTTASLLVEGLQYETDVGVHAIQDVGQNSISSMTTTASLLVEGLQYETDVGVRAIQDAEDKAIQNIKGSSEDKQTSFKADLKDYLIKDHLENSCSLTLGPGLDLADSGFEDLYSPPNISRVYLQSIHSDKTPNDHTTEPLENLKQLFSSKGIIFLTADAGVGKTSFCKFLVLSWCKVQEGTTNLKSKVSGTQTVLSDIEYLKEFSYLFYINCHKNQRDTLEDIIFSHTVSVHTKLTKDNKAFDDMLSNENGLFILDGLDECNIISINRLALDRKYTVLITSRPWKLANMNMPRKYTHAKIEVMKQDLSEQLVIRANDCLNKHFKTSYEAGDFFYVIKAQSLEAHLQNPMLILQLLRIYHDKRSGNKTSQENATVGSSYKEYDSTLVSHEKDFTNLGKTRSHVYANMLELMLRSVEKKDDSLVQRVYDNKSQTHVLPKCFGERNYICNGLAKLLHDIGKVAAFSLLDDNRYLIEEHQIRELRKDEMEVLLKSGLLSKTSLNTISGESNMYTFLHQTYKEMLACVFLSSQDFDSDVWRKLKENFDYVVSPDFLSFLCVMNYEKGCKCLDMFNERKRLFVRNGIFYESELVAYQTTIKMAHKECSDNGIKKPRIILKHALLDPDSGIETDHALLQESGIELETLFIHDYTFTTAIELNLFSNSLARLYVKGVTFRDDHIDLSKCTHLSKITIQDTRLSRVIIDPSCLEMFWVYLNPELIQEIPPIMLSFVGGSQFSSNLKQLSLVHVTMDVPLDLANCQKLHKLAMENTSSNTMTDLGVVCNMQSCDALQELQLETLTFPVDTFLDLSGLTHLSKINIQNTRVSRVIINPSCLEMFWVFVNHELIQEIPPMKLSFVGGSQFSSHLKQLSLVHVTMDATMTDLGVVRNMQRCSALKELRLDTLTFPVDTHLDLNCLTHLSKIIIVDTRLSRVTINPSCLEMFWVYLNPELIQEIPPIMLSFVGGSKFSSNLKRLILVHVAMDVPLDLANCQKLVMENTSSNTMTDLGVVCNMQRCDALQELRLGTLTFPVDTHLDLSGLTHLSKITIQHTRLSRVTINPSCLEEFWVYVKPELIQEIPPMKLSFVGGFKFSSKLTMLSLIHTSSIHSIDISECVQLQTLRTGHILQIGTLGLPRLEEVRLFGAQTEVCNIVLQLISESSCPCKRVWFENLTPEIFSSLTVSQTYAQKFESFKFRFMCLDINVFDFIKTAVVDKVEFEEVKIVKAQQLVALLTCFYPFQASDNTVGGMVKLPFGLRVSDISFSYCPVLGSTKEEVESAIECLRQVWEIKEFKIETQQSSISNTVCGEDIISESHIVLKSLKLKSN